MREIRITLDRNNSAHQELVNALEKNLLELSTVRHRVVREHEEPGTLGGPGVVVGFVIEHYDKLIPLVTALVTLANRWLGPSASPKKKSGKGGGKKAKRDRKAVHLVLEVGPRKLFLPASVETQRRFLRELADEDASGQERKD